MHDCKIHNTTTVRHSGSVGAIYGFSKPTLLIWSATSICTGDDIHCASAATAISGDAVEGGCKDIYNNRNVQFNKHWSEEISGKPALTKVWMYNVNEPKHNVWLKTL